MNKLTKNVYPVYSRENDITTIFEDVCNGDILISTEVKGFYFGIPDENTTNQFYGKLKADYSDNY
jgi:hypothetical protein